MTTQAEGRLTKKEIERFWSSASPNESGCLVWGGSVSSNGYGAVYLQGRRYRAHRLAYELRKGIIPAGKQLDHLCRNRLCINPEHLEAVTQKENILRGQGAPAKNARKTHCPQGHPYTANNLYLPQDVS